MTHPRFVPIALLIVLLPCGCVDSSDPEDFRENLEAGDPLEEGGPRNPNNPNVNLDGAANDLSDRDDPSFGFYVPTSVAQNTIYNRTFSAGGESCNFSFYFGNYGVGYAWIKMSGGPGCGGVSSYVVAANAAGYYDDFEWRNAPSVWAPATASAGNIIHADYCVELHSWGSLNFGYNALTNTLEYESANWGDYCY